MADNKCDKCGEVIEDSRDIWECDSQWLCDDCATPEQKKKNSEEGAY